MDRRHFMGGIAGAVGGPLLRPVSISAADGALETSAVTLGKPPSLCNAPQFIAEELLRAEGFTEIRFVEMIGPKWRARSASARSISTWSMLRHSSPRSMLASQ